MRYETGLEFGRNAAVINEAYAKMVNEQTGVNEPSPGDSDYISDEEKELMHNRIQRMRARRAAEKKAREEMEKSEVSNQEADMMAEIDALLAQDDNNSDADEDEESGLSAEDDFYNRIILGNPDWFTGSEYDMDAIKSHKKELLEKSVELISQGYSEKDAATAALEKIPGCESKATPTADTATTDSDNGEEVVGDDSEETSDDVIGNIDDDVEDVEDVEDGVDVSDIHERYKERGFLDCEDDADDIEKVREAGFTIKYAPNNDMCYVIEWER